jgi:hypothetical protein
MIIRRNTFKNVKRGPWWKLGGLSGNIGTGLTLSRSGTVATVSVGSNHDLEVADRVQITNSSPASFNGVYAITKVPSLSTFEIAVASDLASSATNITLKKLFGLSNLLVEKNVIELAIGSDGEIAIHINDSKAEDPTPSTSFDTPDYDCLETIIRENRIRYVNGQFETSYVGTGIKVSGVKNVMVQNNVVEVAPSNPLKDFRCGTVNYFNNKTPAGALIQGVNGLDTTKYSELETEAEDALVLTLLG